MLELRLTADAKRIASMRDAIHRECLRLDATPRHAEAVALLAERLASGGDAGLGRRAGRRRAEVLVIVTVQSDATMLMVRESTPDQIELGARRQLLLQSSASRWSTMSGGEGRTIWAEIARSTDAVPAREPATPALRSCHLQATMRSSRTSRPVPVPGRRAPIPVHASAD